MIWPMVRAVPPVSIWLRPEQVVRAAPQETWSIRKDVVNASGGLVAAQHVGAAEIGADVLAAGGNAVDAALATSLALGVLEPWMSGLGGGGG